MALRVYSLVRILNSTRSNAGLARGVTQRRFVGTCATWLAWTGYSCVETLLSKRALKAAMSWTR